MSSNKNAKLINPAAILSGSAHLELVRGVGAWGAGYIFGSGGLTNDIKLLADTFKFLSSSGAYATDAEMGILSGYIASGSMPITTYAALNVFSGYLLSGGISQLALDSEVVATSGNIITRASGFADTVSGYLTGGKATYATGIYTYSILPATSGTANIGSTNKPWNSGIYVIASDDSTKIMKIICTAAGGVTGIYAF